MAVGLVTAVNAITIGVLIGALYSESGGLSENATQILTTAFGGMIGVLGSYIGYRSARSSLDAQHDNAMDTLAQENGAAGTTEPAPARKDEEDDP